eukprot:4333989-Prymnesium_polylepis.1
MLLHKRPDDRSTGLGVCAARCAAAASTARSGLAVRRDYAARRGPPCSMVGPRRGDLGFQDPEKANSIKFYSFQ